MKLYYVEAPLVGKMMGNVKANSPEEAIERFINTQWTCGEPLLSTEEVSTEWLDFEALELRKQINRGNVVHGPLGEAFAELDDSDDSED